jgi:hypothetical protein
MKYTKIIFFVAALAMSVWSCNRDEIFEREQYKHVVALLSEGSFNIFAEEHELGNDMSVGYVAASCGGALPITEPITIQLQEASEVLLRYNTSNFDQDVDRYAHYLSPDRYTISEHLITIPANERSGKMKILVRADNLSPDSTYFIPFRVVSQSAYEMNPVKNTVLYRVYMKNFYATTKSVTSYQHRGIRSDNGVEMNTMMQKEIFPIAGNEVRIFAGNTIFENDETSIIRWAIRLTMADDGHVTISPWDNSLHGMKVTQIDGDPEYPNVFKITDDGYKTYKTFLLYYEYLSPEEGLTYRIKEELRTEYIEEKNK